MMLEALKALQQDPATCVLVLISKPPAEAVVQVILKQVSTSQKPTVICFLGGAMPTLENLPNVLSARTLDECAWLSVRAVQPDGEGLQAFLAREKAGLIDQARRAQTNA